MIFLETMQISLDANGRSVRERCEMTDLPRRHQGRLPQLCGDRLPLGDGSTQEHHLRESSGGYLRSVSASARCGQLCSTSNEILRATARVGCDFAPPRVRRMASVPHSARTLMDREDTRHRGTSSGLAPVSGYPRKRGRFMYKPCIGVDGRLLPHGDCASILPVMTRLKIDSAVHGGCLIAIS